MDGLSGVKTNSKKIRWVFGEVSSVDVCIYMIPSGNGSSWRHMEC